MSWPCPSVPSVRRCTGGESGCEGSCRLTFGPLRKNNVLMSETPSILNQAAFREAFQGFLDERGTALPANLERYLASHPEEQKWVDDMLALAESLQEMPQHDVPAHLLETLKAIPDTEGQRIVERPPRLAGIAQVLLHAAFALGFLAVFLMSEGLLSVVMLVLFLTTGFLYVASQLLEGHYLVFE